MKVELSNELVSSILSLDKNWNESDETCFEAAAQQLHEVVEAIKTQKDKDIAEREAHTEDIMDSVQV